MRIKPCDHVPAELHSPNARGCEECLAMGDTWVHLRLCVHCGHIGCCDDSKNQHGHAVAERCAQRWRLG